MNKKSPAQGSTVAEVATPGGHDYSWCKRIFDDLEPPKAIIAGADFDPDKEPEWVQNVFLELMQQAMPAFNLRKPKGYLPREAGLLLGQQRANLWAIGCRDRASTEENRKKWREKLKEVERHPEVALAGSAIKVVGALGPSFKMLLDFLPVFEKALHNAFKRALSQPNHQEAVEFFQGFAIGLAKTGITSKGLARATDATPVYRMMFVHRQEVDRLPSVPKLREFLLNHGLSENEVGHISRLRRLCTRIGYAPGKRGRPPKSKK